METTTRDITNNISEEAAQIKPENNNKGGWFGFFKKNNGVETVEPAAPKTEEINEVKPEQITETKQESVTIDVEPEATPSTSKPVIINEINLYDDEPSLKDIPLDIYDDSIKLEPQNPKNVNYHSIDNTAEIENGNINNINLYESTPEVKKTFFRKIKEIYMETVRLIKLCIHSIFAFIWAIIGGTITGIFTFFRNLFFNTLRAFIKFMIKSKKTDNSKDVISRAQFENVKEDMWDINKMLITQPLYHLAE